MIHLCELSSLSSFVRAQIISKVVAIESYIHTYIFLLFSNKDNDNRFDRS